jgi:hypothetical protein
MGAATPSIIMKLYSRLLALTINTRARKIILRIAKNAVNFPTIFRGSQSPYTCITSPNTPRTLHIIQTSSAIKTSQTHHWAWSPQSSDSHRDEMS